MHEGTRLLLEVVAVQHFKKPQPASAPAAPKASAAPVAPPKPTKKKPLLRPGRFILLLLVTPTILVVSAALIKSVHIGSVQPILFLGELLAEAVAIIVSAIR